MAGKQHRYVIITCVDDDCEGDHPKIPRLYRDTGTCSALLRQVLYHYVGIGGKKAPAKCIKFVDTLGEN